MSHFSLLLHLTAEVYPLLCPPGVLPVWNSSLLYCAHECVPTVWELDLLWGHLLLLHLPQHHRLWRFRGRYGTPAKKQNTLQGWLLAGSSHIVILSCKTIYLSCFTTIYFYVFVMFLSTLLWINCVFPLQTIIQTNITHIGTVSSWPRGSSSAWPGWPCL